MADCCVTIDWANVAAAPTGGVVVAEVRMSVTSNGSEEVFVDRAYERFLSPEDLVGRADASGALRVCGWYGDFDIDQPFDEGHASRRMIAVLEKTP